MDEKKSWKKINAERKALKRKYKQEKLIKDLEKSKKLQQNDVDILANISNNNSEIENKDSALKNISTISIAIPGSILENAQSPELRSYLAGQIARAACIFQIDEIIVYDDLGILNAAQVKGSKLDEDNNAVRNSCLLLSRILQYLECPQYLRKFFFPLHKDLKYSGLLNPLDAPHHLRQQNSFMYREGITTDKKVKDSKNGCFVNIGLLNEILIDKALQPGIRVTVKINKSDENKKKLKGIVVPPSEPRLKTGIYWGYTVRIAHSISEIFTKSPFEEGYDLTIGTSDKGSNIHDVKNKSLHSDHALVVFGGLKGLEIALENDDKLNVDDPKLLFDQYLNTIPNQGSRTIRTEEALLISMTILQEKLDLKSRPVKFEHKEYIAQSEDTGIKKFDNIVTNNVTTELSRFD